ncbi:MAG: FAD-dependent oxidoreductase [Thermodesulfobacteriota bacterium]
MEKVAIIGGGVAGLTAGYLLHDLYDITLFEKDNRLGGNVYTLKTSNGEELDATVFFYSKREYPHFCKLLKKLGIKFPTLPLEGASQSFFNIKTKRSYFMSCDITTPRNTFSLKNIKGVFHQAIVVRNYNKGIRMYREGKMKGLTLRQALPLLPSLKDDVLKLAIFPICIMTSMSWDDLMGAPAEFVFAKIEKQFGSFRSFVSWRLFPCKTREYVEKLAAPLGDRIKLNAKIQTVRRDENGVTVSMEDGTAHAFDKVIFACPADRALAMIENPTGDEKRLLGAWRYNDGLVVVHRDKNHYPPEDLWAMYSYLYTDDNGKIDTSINAHYRFQRGVPRDSMFMGTQYPNVEIDKNLIEFQKVFRTPIYDHASTATIKELPSLNGKMRTYFCGSHFGFGLHEDAVKSAVNVSRMLGARWD